LHHPVGSIKAELIANVDRKKMLIPNEMSKKMFKLSIFMAENIPKHTAKIKIVLNVFFQF